MHVDCFHKFFLLNTNGHTMRIIHKNGKKISKFAMFHNPDSKRKKCHKKKYLKNLKHQGFRTEMRNLLNLRKHFFKIDVDVCLLHVETLYSKIRHI